MTCQTSPQAAEVCLLVLNPQIYCLPTTSYILGQILKVIQGPPGTWAPWLCPHTGRGFPRILWQGSPHLLLWTRVLNIILWRHCYSWVLFTVCDPPLFHPSSPCCLYRSNKPCHSSTLLSKSYWFHLEAWLVPFRSEGMAWFIFGACGSNPLNAPVLKNNWPDCKTQ